MPCERRRSLLSGALRRRGLSIAAVASETGLSINAARRIVRGVQVPSILTALTIGKLVGERIERLFGYTVDPGEGGSHVDRSCRARGAGRG